MSALGRLQALVHEAILDADADSKAIADAGRHVNASPGLSPAAHLRIYRRAVTGTFTRALATIYPVCRRLVGEDFFAGMARLYMHQTASRSPDLGEYGQSFAEFIEAFEPASGLPYLPEVARLEWCCHRAFYAGHQPELDYELLAQVADTDRERLVFHLPTASCLLDSKFPIHTIWQVNQADWNGSQAVNLEEGGVRLIAWRQDNDMRIDLLDDDEWTLLRAIRQRTAFSTLANSIAGIDALLPRCVEQGWVAGFELTTSKD